MGRKRQAETEPAKKTKLGKYEAQFGKQLTDDEIKDLADEFWEWINATEANYIFADFFIPRYIAKIKRQRLMQRSEYFRNVIDAAREIQETKMYKLSLRSDKPTALIFALKNVCGWRDKAEDLPTDEQTPGNLEFSGWDNDSK